MAVSSRKAPAKSRPRDRKSAGPAKIRGAQRSRSPAASARTRATRRAPSPAVLARNARKLAQETLAHMVPAETLGLLEQDHRESEAFFEQFEQDEQRRPTLARKICLALTIHATIEEEILYPAARAAAPGHLLDEAEVEHAAAKQLIGEIEAMGPDDRLFPAKVKVLGNYVKHHIAEEEGQLFPKLRDSELDLIQLGLQLAERRIALLNELAPGLHTPQRRGSSRPSRQRQNAQPRKRQSSKAEGRAAKRRG